MNITYESHRPFSVLITPQGEECSIITKFRLNCGLIVSHTFPIQVKTKDITHRLEDIFQHPCMFEIRRCKQGIMASAVYFEEDQTRQYIRGESPFEIMQSGFIIGVSPNGDD